MLCLNCTSENPENAKFCNQCGHMFDTNPDMADETPYLYGIFYEGGYGDGYNTSFGLERTQEEAMSWVNSPASLSLNRPKRAQYLGVVTEMELLSTDRDGYISQRFLVHEWFRLNWNGDTWEVGEKMHDHPLSIGLSPLE